MERRKYGSNGQGAEEGQALARRPKGTATAYQLSDSEKGRPITTAYMDDNKNVIKKITSINPNSALMRAYGHMIMNHYGGSVVQVYSTETGRLYGELVLSKKNELVCTHKADPTEFDDPLRPGVVRALAYFL